MNKVYVETLGIIVTEKCNLNCNHCLRGEKQTRSISREVVDALFSQVKAVDILNICGGEPLLAIDEIAYIFNKIIDENIYVRDVFITINGTLYDEEFIKLCAKMDKYIKKIDPDGSVGIGVSYDQYHLDEMLNKGIGYKKENFTNDYYMGVRTLDKKYKVFREGNAENLSREDTLPLRPMKTIIVDYSGDNKIITHRVGPFIAINIDGTITEDNTTYEKQQTIYNYGNILQDDLILCLKNKGAYVTTSEMIYRILCTKEKVKYLTYKK